MCNKLKSFQILFKAVEKNFFHSLMMSSVSLAKTGEPRFLQDFTFLRSGTKKINFSKKLDFFRALFVLLTVVFCCSCKFNEKLPDWQNLKNYKPDDLKFGETKMLDFKNKYPDITGKSENDGLYIFSENLADNKLYSRIRIGFNHDSLDWIEFSLNNNVEVSKFESIYGTPKTVNTSYSTDYDYLNYDFFSVTTDKDHKIAYTINIFDLPNILQSIHPINAKMPNYNEFNSIQDLKPGILTEAEFHEKYTGLTPYKKDKFDTNSVYTLTDELNGGKKLYKKVIFNFNNGLLSSIYLTPENLAFDEIAQYYGTPLKIEPLAIPYQLYEYENFLIVVSENDKTVRNIAIITSP